MTAAPPRAQPQEPRRGLRRGSLSKEIIVAESLRLLDEGGIDGFSLPKLGRALGADQTAVYRHFASKDDLVLAIADRLIEEATDGLEPLPCWVDTLTEMSRRLRLTYLAHPAAASMSAYRTTQGPAEMRAVDILIGAILAAGFEGAQAALMYRAIGDFALSWAGAKPRSWPSTSAPSRPTGPPGPGPTCPSTASSTPPSGRCGHLPDVADDAIFEAILAVVMAGVRQLAPRPCSCHAPSAG